MSLVDHLTYECNHTPDDRADEPSLQELVRDALISLGLLPLTDFRTTAEGPTVRVSFLCAHVPTEVWSALPGFDLYSDGPAAIRVAYRGDLALSALDVATGVAA